MEPDPMDVDDQNQGEDALTVEQQEALDDEQVQGEDPDLDLHAPVTPPD